MMLHFSSLLFSGLWLATFLPHFPNTPFTLTHVSTARRRVRYYWDSDSYQRSRLNSSHLAMSCATPDDLLSIFCDIIRTIDRFGRFLIFLFFNDTATTEIYTLSLHDALPI